MKFYRRRFLRQAGSAVKPEMPELFKTKAWNLILGQTGLKSPKVFRGHPTLFGRHIEIQCRIWQEHSMFSWADLPIYYRRRLKDSPWAYFGEKSGKQTQPVNTFFLTMGSQRWQAIPV